MNRVKPVLVFDVWYLSIPLKGGIDRYQNDVFLYTIETPIDSRTPNDMISLDLVECSDGGNCEKLSGTGKPISGGNRKV